MRRRRRDRTQHREIETERARARNLLRGVARRRDQRCPGRSRAACRASPRSSARRRSPPARASSSVPFHSTRAPKRRASATSVARERHAAGRAATSCRAAARGAGPPASARSRAGEKGVLVAVLRARDAVHGRQVECGQDARVGRQQRRDGVAPGRLPLERLAVVARELAVPREHAEEVELDVRVRIHELLHEPRRRARARRCRAPRAIRASSADARRSRRARACRPEIPSSPRTACPRDAARAAPGRRARSNDGGGDANDSRGSRRDWRDLSACAPAKFFANCHAARPLRDPRCKAHCSASRVRASVSRAPAAGFTPKCASHAADRGTDSRPA